MTDDAAIRVRGLRKTYGSHVAVDGLDLEVRRGECFALLGPNGAGKTTVVEILEGYRPRTSGEVDVLGVDPRQPTRQWRARVGIVLQGTGEFEALTVHEVVRHFATYYPAPRSPGDVLAAVGLAERARDRAGTLSGGQRRRLDVALGIIGNPELLFLDEPTTGFDPEARQEFWELIRGLSAAGTTILLTTHYLAEAEALAHRVGVIDAGRMVEVASPATLGGRETAATLVSWDGPAGRQTVRTEVPTKVVTELAAQFGGEVPGLTVTRPSLEEIYLRMIGGEQRGGAASEASVEPPRDRKRKVSR